MQSSFTRRSCSLSVLVSTVLTAAGALAAAPLAAQICEGRCSISIAATADRPAFRAGETLIFTITVQNTGIVPLEGVEVSTFADPTSNKRPDALACREENRTWIQPSPGGGLWRRQLGNLAPGERRTTRYCLVVEDAAECATALQFHAIGSYSQGTTRAGTDRTAFVSVRRAGCVESQCAAEAIHCLFHPQDLSCTGSITPTPLTAIGRLAHRAATTAGRFFATVDDLARLRVLRDALGATPGGRGVIALYGAHQGELKRLLLADPTLRERAIDVLTSWRPVIDGVIGVPGDPITITSAQVGELESFLIELRVVASPALRTAIDRESQAVDLDSVAGLSADQGMKRLARLTCVPDAQTLCLSGGRIRVETAWESSDGKRGNGRAAPLTSDAGTFWFFNAANVETLVKVVDACTFNGRRWLFAAGLTDVRVVTTATDTTTGATRTYENPLGRPFAPVQDTTAAFACDP